MNIQPNINLWDNWSWNDSEDDDVKPLYIAQIEIPVYDNKDQEKKEESSR